MNSRSTDIPNIESYGDCNVGEYSRYHLARLVVAKGKDSARGLLWFLLRDFEVYSVRHSNALSSQEMASKRTDLLSRIFGFFGFLHLLLVFVLASQGIVRAISTENVLPAASCSKCEKFRYFRVT